MLWGVALFHGNNMKMSCEQRRTLSNKSHQFLQLNLMVILPLPLGTSAVISILNSGKQKCGLECECSGCFPASWEHYSTSLIEKWSFGSQACDKIWSEVGFTQVQHFQNPKGTAGWWFRLCCQVTLRVWKVETHTHANTQVHTHA